MSLLEDRTAAFIVRQWCEQGDSGTTQVWRGSVEHVQTGQRRFFQQYDALVAFLRRVNPDFDPVPPQVRVPGSSDIASACPTRR